MKMVNKYIKLFIFFNLEFCCAFCVYKNLHNGHKIIEIDDEETLKKENITIESFIKELNYLTEKTINLKVKIEEEISKINKLYEEIDNKVTQSYVDNHEKLKKEENDLKEKLQIEVTKIKEKLEKFLTESNEQIRISERINKGVRNLEKSEKNIFKNLTYISKINKTKKDMKNLFQELMRNLKISFNIEKNIINYEEYYFNGIPSPKDIEIRNINSNCFNLNWKIDNININNIDNKQIKFIVEIRKDKKNKNFIKIYEGSNNYCKVDKLKRNTDYEFRICSFYNDLVGSWTKLYKIKTKNSDSNDIDSIILNNLEKKNEYIKILKEWTGFKEMVLLYRGTRDGANAESFHSKCDDQGPTIVLCKNNKEYIFGGYASISWKKGSGNYNSAPGSFLFTLTNVYEIQPTKFHLCKNNNHVYHNPIYGPVFGDGFDLALSNNFFIYKSCWSYFPCTYKDSLRKGKSIFKDNIDNNNIYFNLKEIEVFKINL